MDILEAVKKDIPDLDININDKALEDELKTNIAIYLYSRGYISSGIAAKFLSISRIEFLFLAGKWKVPMFEFSQEELERELNDN